MALEKYAIIVAGGKGLRMGTDLPKQFLLLAGKPVLMRTIEAFHTTDTSIKIILVLPDGQIEYWNDLQKKFKFDIPHRIVHGGSERYFSVKNGLSLISDSNALVAIHDGVRPLVNSDTILRCYDHAEIHGNAIPCLPVHDSVRIIDNTGNKSINRANIRIIQTPQTFQFSLLKDAYDQAFTDDITDDASVIERQGYSIYLTEGNRENIKITSPDDLSIASKLFEAKF